MKKVNKTRKKKKKNIKIEYENDENKRLSRFSKRKMKLFQSALELHELTKSEIFILIVTDSAHMHIFSTPNFNNIVKNFEGIPEISSIK